MIVTGAPGSGKTVALRVAARLGWQYNSDGVPIKIPILITFADYRRCHFNLEFALMESLRGRGFQEKDSVNEYISLDLVRKLLLEGKILVMLDGLDELK